MQSLFVKLIKDFFFLSLLSANVKMSIKSSVGNRQEQRSMRRTTSLFFKFQRFSIVTSALYYALIYLFDANRAAINTLLLENVYWPIERFLRVTYILCLRIIEPLYTYAHISPRTHATLEHKRVSYETHFKSTRKYKFLKKNLSFIFSIINTKKRYWWYNKMAL